jgi:hypothetical protein
VLEIYVREFSGIEVQYQHLKLVANFMEITKNIILIYNKSNAIIMQ